MKIAINKELNYSLKAVVDDERIEREIEELYGKKGASQPMFEFDQKVANFEEEDEEGIWPRRTLLSFSVLRHLIELSFRG